MLSRCHLLPSNYKFISDPDITGERGGESKLTVTQWDYRMSNTFMIRFLKNIFKILLLYNASTVVQ